MLRTGSSREAEISQVAAAMSSADGEHCFDAWVRRRLSSWTSGEIQAFDRWLLDEALYEFVPAVRAALRQTRLAESTHIGAEEGAA